jgi:hypothetical protein
LPDAEIADRLNQVVLAEQLTATTLKRITLEVELEPKTAEQVELLAAGSMFEAPPVAELPALPAPDAVMQAQMLKGAHDYVSSALHLLPDFLAVRVTRSFDNLPIAADKKHAKPKIEMHFVQETRREIAVRDGREESIPADGNGGSASLRRRPEGFSTWGEFGAILATVLEDSFNGSVSWSRWQTGEDGKAVAVFQYVIPRSASHDAVDFCCYSKADDDPATYSFHDRPGYHGEIWVDPASGEIDRITLEAELNGDDEVTTSRVAVQYGSVEIAGKRYVCPFRSVAVSEVHNRAMEKIDGTGLERHVNLVQFVDYHKFGSTARVVTNPE